MSHHQHTQRCHDLLGQLSNYIDGELDQGLCAEIEAHLAGCHDCRVVVDTTRKTVLIYRHLGPPPPLPAGVRERLWDALARAGCGQHDEGKPAM